MKKLKIYLFVLGILMACFGSIIVWSEQLHLNKNLLTLCFDLFICATISFVIIIAIIAFSGKAAEFIKEDIFTLKK